ncbi:MAG: hypothetical protein NUW24_16725 [Anaerolineae bacterium]|nr:hypothetical protein [Anaerolineae bacterium]
MTDATAGLDRAEFPATVSAGGVYTTSGPQFAHPYTFTLSSTAEGVYQVAVYDRAGNDVGVLFTVPARSGSLTISVAWSGTDQGSGVASYDVQVKVDDGGWTAWLTDTTDTEAVYSGELGHTYTFRVRATDNVSNTGAWAEASTVVVQVTKYYTFGDRRVATRREGVVYYLHGDHLGSVSLVTDYVSEVVARQWYYPYGETRYTTGALPTDFTFTGQRAEAGLGLLDYRARFYAPVLGRFVSADTIVPEAGNPQDLNRYAYVRNNPLRYTDPSGYCIPGVNCPDDPSRPAWSPPSGYRPQSTEEQIALLGWVQAQINLERRETGGTVVTSLMQQSLNLELSTLMKYVSPEKAERLAWQGAMMGAPFAAAAVGSLAGDVALSLSDYIFEFQYEVVPGAKTFVDWPKFGLSGPTYPNFPEAFESAMNKTPHIHFNLTGIRDVNEALELGRTLGWGPGNMTNTELYLIVNNPDWFSKTTFYMDKAPLSPGEVSKLFGGP